MAASWWRSLVQHGLDPAGARPRRAETLSGPELKQRMENSDLLMHVARAKLTELAFEKFGVPGVLQALRHACCAQPAPMRARLAERVAT